MLLFKEINFGGYWDCGLSMGLKYFQVQFTDILGFFIYSGI